MKKSSSVGERIRRERLRHSLSQEEFADALGVTQTCISRIEVGCREPGKMLSIRIARKLRLSLDYLLLGVRKAS